MVPVEDLGLGLKVLPAARSIGIMEKKMETTIAYWGLYRDNGKENGNYCSTLGVI